MIAIWGANGFIGHHLVRKLIETRTQESVRLFSRNFDGLPTEYPSSFSKYECDFMNPQSYMKKLEDCKTIILLVTGSYARTNLRDMDAELRHSVEPYRQFLETLSQNKNQPEHILYASSGGAIYGTPSEKVPLLESSPCRPSTPYGLGKLLVENMIAEYAQNSPWHYTHLRIANPVGDQGNGLVNAAFRAIRSGERLQLLSAGTSVRDYFDVQELAQAIILLCGRGNHESQIYNIGSGRGLTAMNVIDCVNKVTGQKVPVTIKEDEDSMSYNVLDCGKIEKDIGWKAQNTIETIITNMWHK